MKLKASSLVLSSGLIFKLFQLKWLLMASQQHDQPSDAAPVSGRHRRPCPSPSPSQVLTLPLSKTLLPPRLSNSVRMPNLQSKLGLMPAHRS